VGSAVESPVDSTPSRRPAGRRARAVAFALAAGAAAVALAGCGANDKLAAQLEQQTVTVTVPVAGGASRGAAAQQAGAGTRGRGGEARRSGATSESDATSRSAATSGSDASRRSLTPATSARSAEGPAAARPREPATTPAAEQAPPGGRGATTAPPPQPTVLLRYATALRLRPGGTVVARLRARTEFGSPTVLPVVAQRGSWLGVVSAALPNGRLGWISGRATLEAHSSPYAIDASISRREVVVRRDGRIAMRFPVAVGGPGTPTPRGRFAVTDKLLTGDAASPYGCCILALSGHQPAAPQGWGGGDRIAIHATDLPQTIGTEASLGCLRAPADAIRKVVDTVPLGTIVTISA
jgi:lipoprotein-anchoring transpeptidase ErfK/SrfK